MKSLTQTMTPFYKNLKVTNIGKLRNKTILITGAGGLIGTNLVAFLSYLNKKEKLNLKILAVTKSEVKPWFEKSKNIKYIKADLSKKDFNNNNRIDLIIHAATYAQPKKILLFPKETVLLNVKTIFNLLELAKKNHAKFLYLSSAEIYGEADKKHQPTVETYFGNVNTLSERAIYAESKRLAESICFSFNKLIDIKIARVLLTYGPGLKYDDQRVISEFIKKSQNEKGLEIMGSGNVLRTFCFVGDLVEMLTNVLINGKSIVYNLCGEETFSIKEIAKIIGKINQSEIVENNIPGSISGTPNKSVLSNKKYQEEFNKTKFVKFAEGIKVTSDWFKNLKE